MRGATVRGGDAAMDYIFQSTRPMRGATPEVENAETK